MRISRAGLVGLAVTGLAVLTAGCGGGSHSSDPGVASLGSTTTAAASSQANGSTNASNYAKAVAYSQCMQSHGVPNFPDPNSSGQIMIKKGGPGGSGKAQSRGGGNQSGFDPNSPAAQKAQKACQHLAPGGNLSPAQKQKMVAQALKYSKCMRAHGVANFPDPTVEPHGIGFRLNGKPGSNMKPGSPQFQRAQKACRSDLPGL
ncbi:MAG TPA: hypothetical protein VKV06_15585 [Acidimicrobiales bacterium]|nr:hypothetical protein [Acidimicrobiales bacterium]